jgi:hypothetical protein
MRELFKTWLKLYSLIFLFKIMFYILNFILKIIFFKNIYYFNLFKKTILQLSVSHLQIGEPT